MTGPGLVSPDGEVGTVDLRAVLERLEERLQRAGLTLTEMGKQANCFDAERLCGKAEGVQLALSYLREEQRA